MRFYIDTCILIYAMDASERVKRQCAIDLIGRIIERHSLVVGPQALNELYNWLRRKRLSPQEARGRVVAFLPYCGGQMNTETLSIAWDVEDRTGFQWWDCLMIASAVQSNCSIFISEDMQHDRRIGALRIVNPFVADPLAG